MTSYKINDAGLDLIKSFEGLRLKAYKCPAGRWTIGYGHTSGVKQGDKITREQADYFLRQDVEWAEDAVNRLNDEIIAKQGYDPIQRFGLNGFSALVSFTFNLGAGWTRKSGLRNLLLDAKWVKASFKILEYNKARINGVLQPLAGLTRRRKAEVELFLTPGG